MEGCHVLGACFAQWWQGEEGGPLRDVHVSSRPRGNKHVIQMTLTTDTLNRLYEPKAQLYYPESAHWAFHSINLSTNPIWPHMLLTLPFLGVSCPPSPLHRERRTRTRRRRIRTYRQSQRKREISRESSIFVIWSNTCGFSRKKRQRLYPDEMSVLLLWVLLLF